MAIVPIEILKTKFESGDFPRSSDYQDLIDTLSSASGAITSTNDLPEGATNKYFTDERAQDALGNSLGTGLSYNDTNGSIFVTLNTYDSYGSASTVAGNLSTHESDTTTHGTTGNIVGTSDAQTLTNKTLTSPKINEDVFLTATSTELNVLDGITAATAELNILDGATLSVTELNYVDGVTSSIQTQLNNKAPLADPTFTGTVSGVTKTHVGLGNVDNTTDAGKPVSTATQTALDLKANLAAPTFTGTVSGITATMVGLGNVDNTSDTNKPVSTAQATAIATAKSEVITQILGAGVPEALNTLDELAAALGDDANYAATITTSLGLKAPLASPTLVTPVLGVATATSINGTTIPSTKTLVVTTDKLSALSATTSAELAGVISDETGSGALVFGTSPTLITPVLGVATATSINGTTIPSSATLVKTSDTGTVTSTMISDGTIVNADINASAAIDWTKLAISSTVSATEIGYVDGVTSAIQTQINTKTSTGKAIAMAIVFGG